MDKKLFDDLVESMQQHNEVIAGTRKPARVAKVDAQSIKLLRAVVKRSLDSDDRALHSKVYGDPWKSPKDGKRTVDPNSKWMRK